MASSSSSSHPLTSMSFSLNLMNYPRNNECDVSVMASSSSSRNSNKYDVFLSFRGEDTRENFTSHLYSALRQNNIETFIDNDLMRGAEISQSLLDTIEASTISIIIFSERYASSGWCLDELLKILECKHDYGQIVIPVFCRVDPSHVRGQTGTFGDFFSKLEERFPGKMQRWRSALTEAANLSGFDSRVIRPESKLIEEIANEVLERLDDTFQSYNKDLVGVEWRIKEIESLLCTGFAGVYILGIWGIGGIGKTTIADAVFNKISRYFEGSYFAHNVRDAEETCRIKDLQKELLSNVLNDRNVRNVRSQLNRLARKKVLIVFDDVNNPGQIESLIGRLDQLASGSRVIITTRDKQVLKNCWASQIYRMKELVYADAYKLFSQYAFRGAHLDASYTELIHQAIEYAQGVPLALKVLGRYLCERSKKEWESAMRKLEIIPHMEIQEVLKISYDSLDDSQKNVFLDIACFLEGENIDEVISFFDASGFQAKIELSVLEDKSLITIGFFHRIIRMHDLLRDMGREIVRKESIDHPGKRSRLWHHKDIFEVLKKNTGTEAIKGISLDMRKVNSEIQTNSYTFSKMTELRFLKFYGDENKCMVSHLEGVSFAELRYFDWPQCPLKTLNIRAENLVSLKMHCSKVEQLWDDVQNLVNLKIVYLRDSKSLTKLPDLSLARNLEILHLSGCSSLTETHSSVQYLNKLEVLDLKDCESLTSLPTSIPSKHLKELELSGCSELKNFPEISSSHIYRLDLTSVGIKELPSPIECVSKLRTLRIKDCSRLENISSSIFKLHSLDLLEIYGCSNLKRFLEIPSSNTEGSKRLASFQLRLENCSSLESPPSSLCMFKSLTSLKIIDCPNFERLPDEIGDSKALRNLRVEGTVIREVPESIGQLALLSKLELKNCSELEHISSSIFKLPFIKSIEISNCSNLKGFSSCNADGTTGIVRLGSLKLRLENCSSLESLPSSLSMCKFLTILEIIDCKTLERLPDELGNLEYFKWLTVDGTAIREIPESLGQLALLSKLELKNCSELEYISSSIFNLKSLGSIEISNCSNLKEFPEIPSCNIDGSTEIKRLSSSALKLNDCPSFDSFRSSLSRTSLKIIYCTKLERLPDELGNLKGLKQMNVKGTAIREVPESLGQLSSLQHLELSANNLERIPESLGQLSSLQYLILSDNRNLERIPESIRHLSKLIWLFIRDCARLQTLPELPCNLELLRARNCTSLETLSAGLSSISSNLSVDLCNCLKLDPNELSEIAKDWWMKQSFHDKRRIDKRIYFPGNEIPKWFRYQSMGSSVTFKMPPPPAGNNKLIALCAVVVFSVPGHYHDSNDYYNHYHYLFCNWMVKFEGCYLRPRYLGRIGHEIDHSETDHVFLGCLFMGSADLGKSYDEVNEVSFSIHLCGFCKVKKCGIHFAYAKHSIESHPKRQKCSSTL